MSRLICEYRVGTLGIMIPHSGKCEVWASPNINIWIFCVLMKINYQYKAIISTSTFRFHNILVIKYYDCFSIFSLDYEYCPFA